MKKKIIITLAILALFTIFLAGCSTTRPSLSSAPTSTTPSHGITNLSSSPPSPGNTPAYSPMILQSALPLTITEPVDTATLTMDTIMVKGQTAPGATVSVNEEAGMADDQGNFSIPLSLEEGPFAIDIIAINDHGDQGEVLLLVNVELSPGDD
jgi:hypothetical protein